MNASDIFIIAAVILVAAIGIMVYFGKKNYAKISACCGPVFTN